MCCCDLVYGVDSSPCMESFSRFRCQQMTFKSGGALSQGTPLAKRHLCADQNMMIEAALCYGCLAQQLRKWLDLQLQLRALRCC